MPKIRLAPNAWLNATNVSVASVGVAAAATAHKPWVIFVGICGVAIGAGHLIAGVTLDGEHWWRRFFKPVRPKSPIKIANTLFIDYVPITDELGVAKTSLISTSLHLQVINARDSGETIRNVEGYLENEWGDQSRLLFRSGSIYRDTVDLRHGKIEFLEVGYVATPDSVNMFGAMRAGGGKKALSLGEISAAMHNIGLGFRSMKVSGNPKLGYGDGTEFRVVITGDDVPAFRINLHASLLERHPARWLRLGRRPKDWKPRNAA